MENYEELLAALIVELDEIEASKFVDDLLVTSIELYTQIAKELNK